MMRNGTRSGGIAGRAATLALLAGALLTFALPAAATAKPPDREVTVTPQEAGSWDGTLGNGTNQSYDAASGKPCGNSLEEFCDVTLLRVRAPNDYWDTRGGGVRVDIGDFTVPASDFDLYIYKSNRDGKVGTLVDTSAGLPGAEETAEIPEADGYYRIHVVYYQVTASSYHGSAEFEITGRRAPRPPDIDSPDGLQDVLASSPRKGFRSHSEMHVAQSPTDPDLLIAGSKFYNRDRDSLREYEFKVGTYVSFNGGRSWRDLGQTRTCKPAKAPEETWPSDNYCYPRDNPGREGTGEEDGGPGPFNVLPSKLRGEVSEIGRPFRKAGNVNALAPERRGGDFGEEYITSDPWVAFDDEGTAYLMVLDSPPFDHGNGWGMSFHRWKTPSRKDLRRGKSWSKRIIINAYPDENTQADFVDDKNTFAVNNAGPDDDGEPGPIVACWGQNIVPAIKQQTVCERSTDGGKSWPGEPVPISPPSQQLVIGVSVVADQVNPDRFYATWLNYTPTLTSLPGEYWFSESLDGGLTWAPATLVTQVDIIPTQFPGQQFRNLSIPIMATGPEEGELYTTYAEYRPASAEDADEMQADIMLVRSTNGGAIWEGPDKVNADDGDADQIQPAPAVTPSGQLNISYFDRRKDPDNFYIDTYLSRSNDGGQTFEDVRVSHDMWDPEQRPPISASGQFIGDYQGLVADDCFAHPFVNDTHLANGAGRDPEFDHGLRRSPYQEAISWRVPNKPRYGGERVQGAGC
ncbi:MAG: sialidase family protein [Solirubrobacterales bacterium]